MAIESGTGVRMDDSVPWNIFGRDDDASANVEDMVDFFVHLWIC